MKTHAFVICIDNCGYEVSLARRQFYEVLSDAAAEKLDSVMPGLAT